MPVESSHPSLRKTTRRPRVALALEYPLMQQGGTEVLVRELLRHLSERFEVILVSGDSNRAQLPADLEKLIFDHLSWDPKSAHLGSARELANNLYRHNIDLAHFHFGGTYEWCCNRLGKSPVYHLARLGVPCLSTNHLVVQWLNCGVHPRRSLGYKLLAQTYAWVSRAQLFQKLKLEVCVSRHDRGRLEGMFPMFRHKIIQLYHSLLPEDAPPPNLANRQPVILCIGTIGGRKAQPNLVEAFARIAKKHSNWRLEIIGRVSVVEDLEKIQHCVASHGLTGRITLPGWLSDEATLSRMQSSSIIAIPSLQEGLGLSLQEALFHGCVGLGTRAGGIPELINHEVNGLLVQPGDIPGLSAALDRLMTDGALLEKLRAQCRPSVVQKEMTSAAMVRNYVRLYSELIDS
jgi:glycosyltransferase involved in cell wall biosynthesis